MVTTGTEVNPFRSKAKLKVLKACPADTFGLAARAVKRLAAQINDSTRQNPAYSLLPNDVLMTMTRALLITLGTFFTGLGFIGIFVPLLPTTPFLLVAAACYARSSQRFHNRLLTNRLMGSYIRNYREARGVTLKHKILTLTLLWVTIILSATFGTTILWVRLLLIIIASGVTYHLLTIKTL